MKTHYELFLNKVRLIHNEIASVTALCKTHGLPVPSHSMLESLIERLYEDEFELAKLLDDSDIVLHAEGTSTQSKNPRLDIVTWLLDKANQEFNSLIKNTFALEGESYRDNVNFELTGLAPGSIYAGFKLIDASQPNFDGFGFDQVLSEIRSNISAVVNVPEYINETGVSDGIIEAIPDAGVRDIAMMTALNLSPSGRNGVHTIDISAPNMQGARVSSELSTKTRVILRESAAKKPVMSKTMKSGSLIGDLREIDLDKNRITIRNIGDEKISVRGVFSSRDEIKMRQAIATQNKIKFTGSYEEDKNGKPRLITIESFEPVSSLI